MIRITTNADEIQRKLGELSGKNIAYALRNGTNELAKDLIEKEKQEIRSVFDRPTPFVVDGLRVSKYASISKPSAEIGFKDVFGKQGKAVERALAPHIPEFPSARAEKGMEYHLRRSGWLADNEWLVPSRTFKLNQYGNIPGHIAQKMLADIGAYRYASIPIKKTGKRKSQYMFGTVGGTKGIWKIKGGSKKYQKNPWSLQFVAVKKRPTYQKRFDFFGLAKRRAASKMKDFMADAIEYEIKNIR